jgi:hypothetical protein
VTERLSDVLERINSVRQLAAVITAMRGIAAARSREARSRLDGIRAYASTVGQAIGVALALMPEQARPPARRDGRIVIALCAEQGFAGAFNEHVLDAALALAEEEASRLGADEAAVIGGAEIYAQALPLADRLRLTEVHGAPEGDVRFPAYDRAAWREVAREGPIRGEKDEFAFSFVDYERTRELRPNSLPVTTSS